jgi:NADH-quinone oxidoreductase subunit E
MLSPEEIEGIEHELSIVPFRRAACIEALRVVQKHRGWVPDEAVQDIAGHLGISAEEVDSVATFYNLIFRRPVGRHVILLCDSVSCWILGYDALREALRRKLGIGPGETTADDRFTLLTVPCLGTCDRAPALLIDGDLHRDLSPERLDGKLDDVLARYE